MELSDRVKCVLFEKTDRMTPFIDSVSSPIYRNVETGEEVGGQNLPIGAMYFYDDDGYYPVGPDGKTLWVKLPNGHVWMVDGQASNCTKPDDKVHRCWVRHGEAPNITVDKAGNTCEAGAGSIIMGDWHGFLRNGYLERC